MKIRVLEERLRLQRIKKYGAAGEKLSDAQLDLLDLEPGVSNVEVQAESEREPLPAPKRRPHPGRQELPAELPRGARDCLRSGTVRLPGVRGSHGGHRLRREAAVGRGAGPLLRDGDQAREAGLLEVRDGGRGDGAGSGADYREEPGERPGDPGHGGGQVQRPPSVVSAERDSGAGDGNRDRPGDAGRMGDAGGPVTGSDRGGDADRVTKWDLHPGG